MMKLVSTVFILAGINFISHFCGGKIITPPAGTSITLLPGSTVKILWRFNNPISTGLFRAWHFQPDGGASVESLATLQNDGAPKILNSSLRNIEVIKPATLVSKNIDLHYNGTYEFFLVAKGQIHRSKVAILVAGK